MQHRATRKYLSAHSLQTSQNLRVSQYGVLLRLWDNRNFYSLQSKLHDRSEKYWHYLTNPLWLWYQRTGWRMQWNLRSQMSSIDVGLRRGVCAGVSQSFCLSASMTSVGSQPSIGWVSRARSLEEELGMEQGRLRTLQSTFSHHKDPQRGRAPASLTPDSRNLVQVLLLANSNQDIQKGDSGKWSFHLY